MENRSNEWHPRNEKPEPTYTVTIYVAAPGTPVLKENAETQPSLPGHMYYSISDGSSDRGYGFAPRKSEMNGLGRIVEDEYKRYQNPLYARTMEVTPVQYEKLKAYGDAGVRGDETHFDLHYDARYNSCVDFVWKGLNHAGIHKRHAQAFDPQKPFPDKTYEGSLKPTRNIDDIERIQPPIPGSPHNKRQRNEMPERTLLHKLLSEESAMQDAASVASRAAASPADRGHPDHAMLEQIRGHVRGLESGQGRDFDQRSEQFSHSLLVLARDHGLRKVDHVVLSINSADGRVRAGENVFVVDGRMDDPAHHRAHAKTEAAVQTPVAESNRQLEAVNERLAQEQVQAQVLAQQREQQATHNPHVMRM